MLSSRDLPNQQSVDAGHFRDRFAGGPETRVAVAVGGDRVEVQVASGARLVFEMIVAVMAADQGCRQPRWADMADAGGNVADANADPVVVTGVGIRRVDGKRVVQ